MCCHCMPDSQPASRTKSSRQNPLGESCWQPTWLNPRSRCRASCASSTPELHASATTPRKVKCNDCRSNPFRRPRRINAADVVVESDPAFVCGCIPKKTTKRDRSSLRQKSAARIWRPSYCKHCTCDWETSKSFLSSIRLVSKRFAMGSKRFSKSEPSTKKSDSPKKDVDWLAFPSILVSER